MAEDTGTKENGNGNGSGAEDKPTPEPEVRTFTQDEVNDIVESRLARDRRNYADYDELKAAAEKLNEIEAANQTELERAQSQIADLTAEVTELTEANQYVSARAALLQEVAKPDRKIVDSEGALEFLLGADIGLVEFGEDGVPLNAGEAVDKLIEKRSYLVSEAAPVPGADQGARGGGSVDQLSEADLKTMSPQEIVKARQEGRLDDLLSGSA